MKSKFLSLLAGAALLGGVGAANAAEPLSDAQLDQVNAAGFRNVASAVASASALFGNTYTAASATTSVVYFLGSSSRAISYSRVD